MVYQVIQEDYQLFLDSLPVAVCILDKRAVVVYTNKIFQLSFGNRNLVEKDLGAGDLLLCKNGLLSEEGCGYGGSCMGCMLQCTIKEALNGVVINDPIEIPLTVVNSGSEEKKWFEIRVMSDLLEKADILLLSFTDVTLYKKKNFKLLQNKKVAEETNKAKSEFLANMSHEIRTPLNGLIGMLDLTLLTKMTEEQKENLEVAKNCADMLLTLINDILDISKADSNKVELENIQFNLKELIQKVTDIHMAKLMEKNLELDSFLEENLPVFVYGDPYRLQQVLNNLLSNAIKFTEKGGVRIEVKVLCKSEESYTITFAVEDTGIGIAPKDLKYLFQLFSQIDNSFTRRYGGSGLGLVISQRLIHLMGGEIKVKSQVGKGSVFYFTIQLKTAAKLSSDETLEIFESSGEKSDRIMVVEDDKANQIVTKKLLYQMGYRKIDVASNGLEAIKLYEKNVYQAILMDIEMPELDGIETTRVLREIEKKSGSHIPIIAVSAHILEAEKEKFLACGMDGYIPKPVDLARLKNILESTAKAYEKKQQNLAKAYEVWNQDGKQKKENKRLTEFDKKLFCEMAKRLETHLECTQKNTAFYQKLEALAHEIRMKALNKGYEKIKSAAFRIELSARKKDFEESFKFREELNRLISL